ncbi:MAG: WG repeat-containing protein [Bacteroidales bacterium]
MVKEIKNIPGEYLSPSEVGVFIGNDYSPQNRTNWEEVASPLTEGYRLVIKKITRGKRSGFKDIFGVINPFGKIIIPLEYDYIGHCVYSGDVDPHSGMIVTPPYTEGQPEGQPCFD